VDDRGLMTMWPTPEDAATRFYDANVAMRLLAAIAKDRKSRSSGRPRGQPQAEWRAVLVLALAALEAGLVDVGLAVHHHRVVSRSESLGDEAAIEKELARTRGRLLDLLPLSAPNAQKIENFMLAHFGVLPSHISVPRAAHFTARSKPEALGGAGSGTKVPFSGSWSELATRLDAIQYFRNAIVHADSRKLATIPSAASNLPKRVRGSIWARQKDGNWSLQMPHAVTAVRTTAAVFNTVAFNLFAATGLDESAQAVLRKPDKVVPFDD